MRSVSLIFKSNKIVGIYQEYSWLPPAVKAEVKKIPFYYRGNTEQLFKNRRCSSHYWPHSERHCLRQIKIRNGWLASGSTKPNLDSDSWQEVSGAGLNLFHWWHLQRCINTTYHNDLQKSFFELPPIGVTVHNVRCIKWKMSQITLFYLQHNCWLFLKISFSKIPFVSKSHWLNLDQVRTVKVK